MLLDSKNRTVTLAHGEGLSYRELEALAKISAHVGGLTFVIEAQPEPEDDLAVTVLGSRVVSSAARFGVDYTVIRLENGDYICSCPDFQHRHAAQGGSCKHIWRVSYYDPIQ